MQSSSKTSIIILIAVLVIGAGVYFYMNGTPTDSSSQLSSTQSNTDAGVVGSKVLSLLHQVKALKIDNTLFTSQVYQSLIDHTVPIYDQPVGKPNPFLNPNPASANPTGH